MWLLPHSPMAGLGWTTSTPQLWVLGPAPVPRGMGLRLSSVQSLSHVRLFATPLNCNMPGFLVLHQLLELVQTHVH